MIWVAIVYLMLLIVRPYEYWTVLEGLYIERLYLVFFVLCVVFVKHKQWHVSPLNAAVLAMFIAFGISTALSSDPALSYVMFYEFLKFSLLYALFQMVMVNVADIKLIVLGYVGVMFLYVGKSAWEFFVNGRHLYRMGISRMIGIDETLGDPNSFAASIAYSLPFAVIAYHFYGLNKYVKMGVAAYFPLAAVAIIFTGSRSGQLTCLLFCFMLILISSRKILYLFLSVLLLSVTWVAMPEDYQQRFHSAFDQDVGPENAAASANSRVDLFHQAIDIFAQYPLVGVGPDMFSRYTGDVLKPHNLYGQILSETGIMGFLAFLVFVTILIVEFYRCIKQFDANTEFFHFSRLIGFAGISTLVLLLFNGLASHNLYRFNWLFLASIAASSARGGVGPAVNVSIKQQLVGRGRCQ